MREIKFRAKDFKGNWVYGTYAYGCFYPDDYKTHRMFPDGVEINIETLGQFVANDVFEDDFIKNTEGLVFRVVWRELGWAIKNNIREYNEWFPERTEVIGNTQDNPELLKEV